MLQGPAQECPPEASLPLPDRQSHPLKALLALASDLGKFPLHTASMKWDKNPRPWDCTGDDSGERGNLAEAGHAVDI